MIKSLAKTSPTENVVFQWSLTAVNTGSLIINLIAVIMFVRFRHKLLSKNQNLLLFSLAISDCGVGIGGILVGQLYYFFTQHEISLAIYKIGMFTSYFGSFFMSILSLTILTFDRLISVKFPLRHRTIMTTSKIICLVVFAWLFVLLVLINQAVLFFAFYDDGWTEIRSRAVILTVFFVAALLVLSTSNAYIFIKIRKRNKKLSYNKSNGVKRFVGADTVKTSSPIRFLQSNGVHGSTRGLRERASLARPLELTSAERLMKSTCKICILLTLLFFICWFPVVVYYLLWLSMDEAPFGRSLLTFSLSLASANSLMNPVVYLAQVKDFRDCFRKTFGRKAIDASASWM